MRVKARLHLQKSASLILKGDEFCADLGGSYLAFKPYPGSESF